MTNKVSIIVSIFLVTIIILFSKIGIRKKIYIGKNQYSIYSKAYVYADIACVFSTMDCNHAGVIYLYDEIEKKVIATAKAKNIELMETYSIYKGTLTFRDSDIKIENKNNKWVLPRLKEKK